MMMLVIGPVNQNDDTMKSRRCMETSDDKISIFSTDSECSRLVTLECRSALHDHAFGTRWWGGMRGPKQSRRCRDRCADGNGLSRNDEIPR